MKAISNVNIKFNLGMDRFILKKLKKILIILRKVKNKVNLLVSKKNVHSKWKLIIFLKSK